MILRISHIADNPIGPEHPLGILMTLAAKGEWRNPPSSSPDYERFSRVFQRLQTLFQPRIDAKLSAGGS